MNSTTGNVSIQMNELGTTSTINASRQPTNANSNPTEESVTCKKFFAQPCVKWTIITVLFIGCILIIGLVAGSFKGVEYNEMGFKRSTISQTIEWDTLYFNDHWFWGVSYVKFVYPRNVKRVKLDDLEVIPTSGLQFLLDCDFYYEIPENAESIHRLFDNFGQNNYDAQVTNIATGLIKNMAPNYTIEQYITQIDMIQNDMSTQLTIILNENNIYLRSNHFFITGITFPEQVIERYSATLIQIQLNLQANYEQNQTLTQKETDFLVSQYNNNATITRQTVYATNNATLANANAEALRIVQSAQANGLTYFFDKIGSMNKTSMEIVIRTFGLLNGLSTQYVIGNDVNVFVNPT